MNKELLLEVISEVIDRNGTVTIHMLQSDSNFKKHSQMEALALAEKFQTALGSVEIISNDNEELPHIGCFDVNSGSIRGWFSYHNNLIEDVDLSGNEEPLPFTDIEEVMKEDMRSEEYISSFDLKIGEGI